MNDIVACRVLLLLPFLFFFVCVFVFPSIRTPVDITIIAYDLRLVQSKNWKSFQSVSDNKGNPEAIIHAVTMMAR